MLIYGDSIFKLCLQPSESILIKCCFSPGNQFFFLLDYIRHLCEAFSITSWVLSVIILFYSHCTPIKYQTQGLLFFPVTLQCLTPSRYSVNELHSTFDCFISPCMTCNSHLVMCFFFIIAYKLSIINYQYFKSVWSKLLLFATHEDISRLIEYVLQSSKKVQFIFHISFLKSQQVSYGVKTGISLIKYTFCHLKSKKILCHCLVSYTVSNTYKSS